MDLLNFFFNLFKKKEEKPGVIISTGNGGGGGGGFGGGAGGAGGSVHMPPQEVSTKNNTFLLILVVVLLGVTLWFGSAIIRLENYHYASQVGFCDELSGLENLIQKDQCLNEAQTRTNSFRHLLYGLKIF